MNELSPEELKGSVWDPEADGIAKDLEELVSLDGDEGFFGDVVSWFRPVVKKKKVKKKKKTNSGDSKKKKSSGPSIPTVEMIDGTQQQPVSIGLSKCPPAHELFEALQTFDLKILAQNYVALINTTIKNKSKWPGIVSASKGAQDKMGIEGKPGAWTMKGKPIKLDMADSYIMALRALPDLNKRLMITETVCGFQENWESIQERLESVSEALNGIYKCDGLAAMLLLAVRMGNAINRDTPEGKAPRLKRMSLKDLILFTQVKGKGVKKESALFYIVYHLMQNEKTAHLTKIQPQLKASKECVKITQMKIEGELKALTNKVKIVQRGVDKNKKSGDGSWEKNLGSFVEQSSKDIESLTHKMEETHALYEKVKTKIAWKPEPTESGWENLFTLISEFLGEYGPTQEKCESTFVKEQKERIKKEKEERMKRRKAEKGK